MAAVVEEEPGSGAMLTTIIVVVFLIAVVILFFGLGYLHWFGFNQPAAVGTAPSSSPPPVASPSAS